MWSVLLVSERDRTQLLNAKFIVLIILTIICILLALYIQTMINKQVQQST